jgi:2-polyprenyl-3-methyl-5-hydroxy-6-metoxy-1,4-benzoquinol methylase
MTISAAVFHQSLHLDDDQLEPPEPGCPFCGSTNRRAVYPLQADPEVQLLACADCHAASAARMPTERALAEYYRTYYQSPRRAASGEKITFDDASRFGRYLASKLRQHLSKARVSILDFGGGDGALAQAVALELLAGGVQAADILVVDRNEDDISPRDRRISITREAALDTVASRHDIVIASAVIEHIPKPRAALAGLLERLQSGGVFYARTPYMLPLMKLLARFGAKLSFTYPAHVHDLGQKFWEGYFERRAAPGEFQILRSNPSIVETTFKEHFLRTVAAYGLKAPWHLLGRSWQLVGGWELFVRKQ